MKREVVRYSLFDVAAGGAARLRYLASYSEVLFVSPSIFSCHQQFYLRCCHQYCFYSVLLPTFTTSVSWLSRLNKTQMARSSSALRNYHNAPMFLKWASWKQPPPHSTAATLMARAWRLGSARKGGVGGDLTSFGLPLSALLGGGEDRTSLPALSLPLISLCQPGLTRGTINPSCPITSKEIIPTSPSTMWSFNLQEVGFTKTCSSGL